ncbi:MAG: CheR family methyltransferase [Beijerinckiaceae bacterium]
MDMDFLFIQQFITARTGIVLTAEKRYLVEVRLDPVVRRFQLLNLAALTLKLRQGDRTIETAVIDAMTTNETLFFRDKSPFELFQNFILPKIRAARRTTQEIRIWCAACSTGQEPYSLSMLLEERKDELQGLNVKILATDISEKVLQQARDGLFSQFEVQRGLPIKLLLKYFTQEGTRWRIDPLLAHRIEFRASNLLQPLHAFGKFDIILCRNVLIYFGEDTKRAVLARLENALTPDGYLLLGGAETVMGLSRTLAPHAVERGLYVHATSPEAYDNSHIRLRQRS